MPLLTELIVFIFMQL